MDNSMDSSNNNYMDSYNNDYVTMNITIPTTFQILLADLAIYLKNAIIIRI